MDERERMMGLVEEEMRPRWELIEEVTDEPDVGAHSEEGRVD